MAKTLLACEDLKKHYPIISGLVSRQIGLRQVINGISFELKEGDSVGLAGESGAGKTVLLRLLMRIERPTEGQVYYEGRDIASLSKSELMRFRREVQMIFQDPVGSLHPRMTIGMTLMEPLTIHRMGTKSERVARAETVLEEVGLDREMRNRYPHQFSGGQRQRVGIARSLMMGSQLILADEPVSALDVSLQAQVLNLFRDLQEELQFAYLFVAHDLAVLRHVCRDIMIMYAGRIVEKGTTEDILEDPHHPYTKALLAAPPSMKKSLAEVSPEWTIIGGDLPDPAHLPHGCHFSPRCKYAEEVCRQEEPVAETLSTGHVVECHIFPR